MAQNLELLGESMNICHDAEIERGRDRADKASWRRKGAELCGGLDRMVLCLKDMKPCYSVDVYNEVVLSKALNNTEKMY